MIDCLGEAFLDAYAAELDPDQDPDELIDQLGGPAGAARALLGLDPADKLPSKGTARRREYAAVIRSLERWSAGETTPTGKRSLDRLRGLAAAAAADQYRDGFRATVEGWALISKDCRHRTVEVDVGRQDARAIYAAWTAGDQDAAANLFADVLADGYGVEFDWCDPAGCSGWSPPTVTLEVD